LPSCATSWRYVAVARSGHHFGRADRWFLAPAAIGARVIQTSIQAPQANGIAERFVRTVRSECVDWLLIDGAQHLERVLMVCIEHDNAYRGHRRLAFAPPKGRPAIERWSAAQAMAVKRRNRLGGLVHEYQHAV
jgi:putative transposase